MKHSELVKIGAHWLHTKAPSFGKFPIRKCQFVVTELACQGVNEIPDIFGVRPNYNVVIEAKISRSDFKRDKHKKARNPQLNQLGNVHYYLTPQKLIQAHEIPFPDWGLLEYNPTTQQIELIHPATYIQTSNSIHENVYYSIIRRLAIAQVFSF